MQVRCASAGYCGLDWPAYTWHAHLIMVDYDDPKSDSNSPSNGAAG